STLRKALRYLIRDAKTFTYRLPHDSWADVIRKGEEDSLTAVVFDWAREIRSPERWLVLKKTSESTWRKVYEDAMFSNDENDLLRALYMAYLHAINFGEVLDGFTEIIEYKPEHRISALLSDLIKKIDSGEFYPGKIVDTEEGGSLEDRVRTSFRRMNAAFSPLPVELVGNYSSISDSDVIWGITELWRFQTSDWVIAVSVGRSGTIYAGGADKLIRALSPDGKELWSLNLGGWITTIDVGPDETVYVGNEQSVIAVRKNKILWSKRLGGWVKTVVADEHGIYVGSDDKMLHIFKDGKEVWTRKLEKAVLALAVSNDGTLYVGAGDILRAIKDGKEVWTRKLE
ncbi:MAG: PQQ-binding-like beta-propeller repeat protein, partial [Candidatus Korarchaeota archaeon]|nr:PQQ-binding-like beta-propeller repeat protein [Candidatus Korarchaeota archaeon]